MSLHTHTLHNQVRVCTELLHSTLLYYYPLNTAAPENGRNRHKQRTTFTIYV